MMYIKKVVTTYITANPGYLLTQAGEVNPKDRVFVTEVALGDKDSIDNWQEVCLEWKTQFETAMMMHKGIETR